MLGAARHLRRQQALGWSFAALGLAVCARALAWRLFIDGGAWTTGSLFAWLLAALAALAAVRARRELQGRETWTARRGALVHVLHGLFRARHTTYASPALVLERTVDSEGDERFELSVRSSDKSRPLGTRATTPRGLLHLGYWLARRLDVPLTLEPPGLRREPPARGERPCASP